MRSTRHHRMSFTLAGTTRHSCSETNPTARTFTLRLSEVERKPRRNQLFYESYVSVVLYVFFIPSTFQVPFSKHRERGELKYCIPRS